MACVDNNLPFLTWSLVHHHDYFLCNLITMRALILTTQNIPSLLLISGDVVNPMRVLGIGLKPILRQIFLSKSALCQKFFNFFI